MFGNMVDAVTGEKPSKKLKLDEHNKKIKGTVVLMKSNFGDFLNIKDSLLDMFHEIFGHKISLQLISSVTCEPGNGLQGKVGKPAYLKKWTTFTPLMADECACEVTFDWEEEIGIPGAFAIRNEHHGEFHLKSLTLEDVPGAGRIHFVCNSWVYPAKHYKKDRVFFTNKTYLPHETPMPLRKHREEELMILRGDGKGELQEWDRVYDYDLYNDLGNPENPDHVRPILGGSTKYPYPRRCRTGRSPTKSDPKTESRLPPFSLNIYVPRDEQFGHAKMSDAIAYLLKLIARIAVPGIESLIDHEFDSFDDILKLYENDSKHSDGLLPESVRNKIPWEFLKEIFRSDGEQIIKFSRPQVIKESTTAWRTDEEFGREMLAGLNPVVIRQLEEFPPKSTLNHRLYGDQRSSIRKEHIENNLDGLSIEEAMLRNKLFILDYHDSLMPYIKLINTTSTKAYASRTIVFLKDDGMLKPVAIELSLPHPEGVEFGAISQVFTPAEDGIQGGLWQLAKAYVAVNDSGYHQLVSHWLHTHATIEPFVIATNRQLSVLHPIYKLLHPHFRDTMNINALARQTLISAGGLLEFTVFPAKYSLEFSSSLYKDWVFTEQALPEDLKKRGIAVEDPSAPHGLRLLIEDYPFAVDGLKIWSAIKEWVTDYCSYYYETNDMVQKDPELQSWWKEIREEGHGDLKDKPWWPNMQSRDELIQSCTIIIWVASALHAAINFGQYPYGGYLPNRPSISRRFMPEKGSQEYNDLETKADEMFLKTITSQFQTLVGISLIEILSRHTSEEVYLGQRETNEWTTDTFPLQAFQKFGEKLVEIEEKIMEMNKDATLKNRTGPVKMPYTLLVPSSQIGLTGRGIPNSISI